MKPKYCATCRKRITDCDCDHTCLRCGLPWRQCTCEESLRPARYAHQDDRFQPDEEDQDDLRRAYGDFNVPQSDIWWHGFCYARKVGPRKLIRCPYTNTLERQQFYAGVSDARHQLR